MLFRVKGKVELDDHDGQHQQSNSNEGDEETWRWKIRGYLMFHFCVFIVVLKEDGGRGFTKGFSCAWRGGGLHFSVGVCDLPGGRHDGGGGDGG